MRDLFKMLLGCALYAVPMGLLMAGGCPAKADDFLDRVKQLEARNAAKDRPKGSATKPCPYCDGTGYIEEYVVGDENGKTIVLTCDRCKGTGRIKADKPKADPFSRGNAAHDHAKGDCGCAGAYECTCPNGTCPCEACRLHPKPGLVIPSDDPLRPWVYEKGWGGWDFYRDAAPVYRPAADCSFPPQSTTRPAWIGVGYNYAPPPMTFGGFRGGFGGACVGGFGGGG